MKSVIREVEAVLFASSRRMSVEDIHSILAEASVKDIENALVELKKNYDDAETSLFLSNEDKTWKLSLKSDYLPLVEKLMPSTDLPKPVVETLAILAWRAPMLQSELIHLRSPVAYEHIAELEKIGLITREKTGRSYTLKLTNSFYDYFDLPKAGFDELLEDIEEPQEESVDEGPKETDEERKERLIGEIKQNQINPEAIIGKDKKYLDEFDKRLEEINAKNSTLSSKDFQKIDLEGTGLELNITPSDESQKEPSDEEIVEEDYEKVVEEQPSPEIDPNELALEDETSENKKEE